MMRLRWTLLAVCGAVVLAACGAQSNGDSGSNGSSSASTTGKATGPIQVGLLITDTSTEAKRNGVSIVNPYRDTGHALIASINAAGGLAGRKVDIVDDAIEFTSPNHDSAFEAICQKFTKDKHVQAVLYDGIVYNEGFNTCLTNAGVPILYMGGTGSPVGDDTDLKNNPGVFVVDGVSVDRRLKSIMNKAIAANYLPAGSKIGVILEDCPYNQRAYDNTLKPIADQNKITLVKGAVKCAHGYADNAPNLAQIQNFALKFKSEGVDSLMFLTVYENGLVYYLAQGAHTQNWTPQYLIFHQQGGAATMQVYPAEQLTKMRGFGGLPLLDLTNPPAPPAAQAAVQQKCLADARAHGQAAQKTSDQITVYQVCDVLRLLQQGLTNSGGQGGTAALVPAIEKIGTSFVSALDLNGVTQFGPGRHDGMELTAPSAYDSSCKCFSYTGGSASATAIQ